MSTPKEDLKIAERLLDEMAECTDLTAFEERWQNFLMRLEKIWDAVKSKYGREPNFPEWASPYYRLRKKDPLLRYIQQARHAEIHSIGGSISRSQHLMIKDKYGRPFSMRQVDVGFENGNLSINLDTFDVLKDFVIEHIPTLPFLVRIKNRGVWYNPPHSHLGNNIPHLHPCLIGKLALDFYSALTKSAEERFRSKKVPGRD